MRPLTTFFSLLAAFVIAVPAIRAQETATTDPVGFVTIEIAGGAQGKVPSFVSIPLLDTAEIQGQVAGTITGVTESTLSNSSGNWEPEALSNPAEPFLVLMTSGDATGKMFLISTTTPNTADTLTINPDDVAAQGSLTALGIKAGDNYKIHPCDTLSSFFGTPATIDIVGGANAKVADTIVMSSPTGPKTYYFSTTENTWVENARRVVDASNVPLRPYYGMIYNRQGEAPLKLIVTGAVPVTPRSVAIANTGSTILAQYWPATMTLAGLGLQNISGWQTGSTAKTADRVVIQDDLGIAKVYFYNGLNWLLNSRRVEISDDVQIPVGASVQVERIGGETGYSALDQGVPYSL